MTAKSHPASMRFIPDQLPRESVAGNGGLSTSLDLSREPTRYVLIVEYCISELDPILPHASIEMCWIWWFLIVLICGLRHVVIFVLSDA